MRQRLSAAGQQAGGVQSLGEIDADDFGAKWRVGEGPDLEGCCGRVCCGWRLACGAGGFRVTVLALLYIRRQHR